MLRLPTFVDLQFKHFVDSCANSILNGEQAIEIKAACLPQAIKIEIAARKLTLKKCFASVTRLHLHVASPNAGHWRQMLRGFAFGGRDCLRSLLRPALSATAVKAGQAGPKELEVNGEHWSPGLTRVSFP